MEGEDRAQAGEPGDLEPIRGDIQDNTETMRGFTDAVEKSAAEARHDRQFFRWLLWWIAAAMVGVLITAGVIVWAVFAIQNSQAESASRGRNIAALVQTITNATSPQAQSRNAQVLAGAIAEIEHCIINHVDHDNLGTPLDPKCPAS